METLVESSITKDQSIDNISKKMDAIIEKQEVINTRMGNISRRYVLKGNGQGITYTMKDDPSISFFISNEECEKGFRHINCGVKHICK